MSDIVLGKVFQVFKSQTKGSTGGLIFTLHYKITAGLLLFFTVVICSRKGLGVPMACMPLGTETVQPGTNSYCWQHSYIMLPKRQQDKNLIKRGFFHPVRTPALPNVTVLNHPRSRFTPKYLHIHQWAEFLFFLMAFLYLLPKLLWTYIWDDNRVTILRETFITIGSSDDPEKAVANKPDDDEYDGEKYEKVVAFLRSKRFGHFEYSLKFIVCEVLNFVNVLAQFVALRVWWAIPLSTIFVNFISSQEGTDGIILDSPLTLEFPDMARCETPPPPEMAGMSMMNLMNRTVLQNATIVNGTVVNRTATVLSAPTMPGMPTGVRYCMLPINSSPVRMFSILIFYKLLLVIISGMALFFYRVGTLCSPAFRVYLYLLKRVVGGLPESAELIVKKLDYGEWFVLSSVIEIMEPFILLWILDGYQDAMVQDGGYDVNESSHLMKKSKRGWNDE